MSKLYNLHNFYNLSLVLILFPLIVVFEGGKWTTKGFIESHIDGFGTAHALNSANFVDNNVEQVAVVMCINFGYHREVTSSKVARYYFWNSFQLGDYRRNELAVGYSDTNHCTGVIADFVSVEYHL